MTQETKSVSGSLTNNVTGIESVPSLASSAMLVDLQISKWTGRRLDKKASTQVTVSNNADKGVANVHKKLLGNCDELEAINKHVGETRNHYHYAMTMPWSNMGLRLVTTANYFNYHKTMTERQTSFHSLVDVFLQSYEWKVSQVNASLGNLFNSSDYPTLDQMKSKFAFNFSYAPLPDAGDFRVDVGNEQCQAMKEQYQDYYSKQLQNAMGDVWTRLHESLSKMSERLDYRGKDDKKTFRDTLVSNVEGMVGLLKTCNVTNDSKMEQARLVLDDALRGVTPDALREDDYLRSQTKQSVDEVIKSLPSINF